MDRLGTPAATLHMDDVTVQTTAPATPATLVLAAKVRSQGVRLLQRNANNDMEKHTELQSERGESRKSHPKILISVVTFTEDTEMGFESL